MTAQHDRKTQLVAEGKFGEGVTRHRNGEFPPCFESLAQYRRWLAQNKQAPVPPRVVFPREPNYCHDCTAAFQATAIEGRVCLFPGVEFHESMEGSLGRESRTLQATLPPRAKEIIGKEKA